MGQFTLGPWGDGSGVSDIGDIDHHLMDISDDGEGTTAPPCSRASANTNPVGTGGSQLPIGTTRDIDNNASANTEKVGTMQPNRRARYPLMMALTWWSICSREKLVWLGTFSVGPHATHPRLACSTMVRRRGFSTVTPASTLPKR